MKDALVLAVSLALFAGAGCDNKPAPPVPPPPAPAPVSATPAPAAAKEKDPVCGMPVGADAPLSLDHEGKKYHFCSQSCLDAFKADPKKYLK